MESKNKVRRPFHVKSSQGLQLSIGLRQGMKLQDEPLSQGQNQREGACVAIGVAACEAQLVVSSSYRVVQRVRT